jgi:hypothetical protein
MEQSNFNNFENKEKLPNEQAVMILGILSYIGCCCTSGILGIILSGIGIYLANKAEKVFAENPEHYIAGNLKTWKIVNYIGLGLSLLMFAYFIYMKVTGKDVEQQEQLMEMIRQLQNK